MLKYIRQLIFGHDIFISHRWTDSSKKYALKLTEELQKQGLDCFIDYEHVTPGDSIPTVIQRAIKRSKMFLLITHEDIKASTWIPKEIKLASENPKRKIIPLNIGRMIDKLDLDSPDWSLLNNRDRIEESLKAFDEVTPSPEVLNRIDRAFTERSNRSKATNILFSLALFMLLATFVPAGFALYVRKQAEADTIRLEAQAEQSRKDAAAADRARKTALDELKAAQDERQSALDERDRFRGEKETAEKDRDAAKTEAEKQTQAANAAAQKADEQTRKADLAEKREVSANERADLQERQAKSNLAENYYTIGQTQSLIDPIGALPWVQKAIATAPDRNERLGVYNLRALQLSRNVPYFVTYSALNPWFATFSSTFEEVLIIPKSSNPKMIDLKSGNTIPVPWNAPAEDMSTIQRAVFSQDNRLAATIDTAYCFRVWQVRDSSQTWKHCPSELENPPEFNIHLGFPVLINFSPDGRLLTLNYSRGDKREIKIYDIEARKSLPLINSQIRAENPEIPLGAVVNGNMTTVTDAKLYYRKNKEWVVRNEIPVSRNRAQNWLITFKVEDSRTIAELKEMNGGQTKMVMELEKIVDFIDFTAEDKFIVTLSHNAGGQKVYRVWDTASGEKSVEAIQQWDYEIIALSKSGQKMLLNDKKSDLVYVCENSSDKCSAVIFNDYFVDIKGSFTDDEQALITETTNNPGATNTPWQVNVWAINPKLDYITQARPPVNVGDNSFNVSASDKILGIVSKNGLVSLWNLASKKEENPAFQNIPLKDDYYIEDAQVTPNFILTTEMQSRLNRPDTDTEVDRNIKVRIRSLAGKEIKVDKTIEFLWIFGVRPSTDLTLAGKRLLGIQKPINIPEEAPCQSFVTVRSISTADEEPGFKPICGSSFTEARFNRTGSQVLTANHPRLGNKFQIQRWDAATGIEDQTQTIDVDISRDSQFNAFTRYGEFVITSVVGDSSAREFKLISTNIRNSSRGHFQFSKPQAFLLAISLLKQADEIKVQDVNTVIAVINPQLSVTISARGGDSSIFNTRTNKEIIAPNNNDTEEIKISADGKLILGRWGRYKIQLWDSETGSPVTDPLTNDGVIRYADFTEDGKNIMIIAADGTVSAWYMGASNIDKPFWIEGQAEALTGAKLNNGTKPEFLASDEYIKKRQEYLEKLKKAAADNDTDAQFILKNWNP